MKSSLKTQTSNNMPIIRIVPVCGGKVYVTKRPLAGEDNPRMDLPIMEEVQQVSEKSGKAPRKVLTKYQGHIHTDATPRFCVKHRSASSDDAIIYLYVLPLKSEDEIHFHKGEFVTNEDIANHPESYAPDLQMESELLGMAAELWEDFYTPHA